MAITTLWTLPMPDVSTGQCRSKSKPEDALFRARATRVDEGRLETIQSLIIFNHVAVTWRSAVSGRPSLPLAPQASQTSHNLSTVHLRPLTLTRSIA